MLDSTLPPIRRVNHRRRPRKPYVVVFCCPHPKEIYWDQLEADTGDGILYGWDAVMYLIHYGWRPIRHGAELRLFRYDVLSDWVGHA